MTKTGWRTNFHKYYNTSNIQFGW